ncbi:flavodoxin domain-containing protein [Halosquirtibacter xylanolyticus]|uniref:flavodoxin domain-containing protein n=1 Tax=Halosquirtibacter xylanolyticus TaxID=3374599 RepID=UPI003749BDDA|nr:flavodoxin domain-containing protein [Prolixibacteraceae bacterium]
MKAKIAILTSSQGKNTQKVAEILQEMMPDGISLESIDIDKSDGSELKDYKHLIMGLSTWFDGEIPFYWDEFLPSIEDQSFKGKKVAIYSLGDAKNYPDNFCDAIGVLSEWLEKRDAKIIGCVSTKGYHFDTSYYIDNDEFKGLPVEFNVEDSDWERKLSDWSKQILKEFTL